MPPKLWKIRNPLILPVVITLQEGGSFRAEFPSLPGCMSQGKTMDDAIFNLARAIEAVLGAARTKEVA
jgi:predicted RNase H-like HicB family nuclease